jgi:CheY-specific phosphatase CheX
VIETSTGPVDVQSLVEGFAREACESLFRAYGVGLEGVDPDATSEERLVLGSVIGFTGPTLRGTCILAATELPLRRSNPVAGSLRNWMAELANQLVGRIKNQLLSHGAEEVYVTTPVVMRGEHLAPLPRFVLKPQAFAASVGGTVLLWVEVEADPEFRLSLSPQDPPASEGDALLF